jgi:ATP-binding cassette, subfamily B, bacterial
VTGFLRKLRVLLAVGFRATPRLTVLAFTLGIVGAVAGPLVGLWLKSLVDAVSAGNQSTAVTAAVGLIVFWVASIVASQYANHVSWGLHVYIMRFILSDLIEISGRVPTIELHERPDVADKLELLRGDALPFAFAMTAIVWAVGIVLQLATTIVVVVSVSPVLVLLPLLGIPSVITSARTQRMQERIRDETAEQRRLSEHLFQLGTSPGPGKELRMFSVTDEIAKRHHALRRGIRRREHRAALRGTAAASLGWLAYAVGYGGAIVFVTAQAVDGKATAGDVLLVIAVSAQIQDVLGGAYWLIGEFVQTLSAAERYLWIRDFAESSTTPRRSTRRVPERIADGIRFEDISFRYPGTEADVLRNVDLTIPAGTAMAIVGVNGAGKTTLAKLLAGFYEPTSGRITVDGVDLRDIDLDEWRARMSACFQDFVHFQYLAQESVGLGELSRIEDEASIREAVARASATDVIQSLPNDLRTLLGPEYGDGVELSTGQWQKVALGRAMMREEPLLLILDEPTASLDAYTEHAIFERYARASERAGREVGAISLLISHRFSTVRMADLVVVLEAGEVAQVGTHADLGGRPGPYRELYELQSRAYR